MFAMATLVSGAALAKGATPKHRRRISTVSSSRPSEPVSHVFSRTPAFAWAPTRGALCYEFELATSRKFGENAIVWSNVRYGVKPGTGCAAVAAGTPDALRARPAPATGTGLPAADGAQPVARRANRCGRHGTHDGGTTTAPAPTPTRTCQTTIQPLRVPAVSVDVALPWFTGQPYALYAHVRAITTKGPTGWSTPFAFNMRWPSVPTPLPTQPGLVRWSRVSGATGYQVWYPDDQKVFSTHTNVADLREFYTSPQLVHDRELARAGRTARVRHGAERSPCRLVRPVEPDVHGVESGARRRGQLHGDARRSPTGSATARSSPRTSSCPASRSPATSRLERCQADVLPRLRRDRSRLRQRRLQGLARRQPRPARRAPPARSRCGDDGWAARAGSRCRSRMRSRTARPTRKEWSNDWRPIVSNEVSARTSRRRRRRTARLRRRPDRRVAHLRRHPGRPAGHRLPDDALLLDGRSRHVEGERLRSDRRSAGGTSRRRRTPAPPAASRASARRATPS